MRLLLSAITFLILNNLAAQAPKEKTLLWEITGNGIKQPSYLFGTIHLMCPQDLEVPPVVKTKFNTTKELFLEVDLDDPDMMQQMMQGVMMKDNVTIKDLIGEAKYDSLNTIFQKRTGMSLNMMQSMKPLLLMSLIYPSLLGCEPDSWERNFQKMASGRHMELKGLEDVSAQINVLEKIPYKVQAEMFAKTLLNIDSTQRSFTELLNIYKAKDINRLYVMTTAEDDFGDYEGVLLKDRNDSWIPVISKQVKETPTFFACGAAHLGGDIGVISLLRKQGFTVKPVTY